MDERQNISLSLSLAPPSRKLVAAHGTRPSPPFASLWGQKREPGELNWAPTIFHEIFTRFIKLLLRLLSLR